MNANRTLKKLCAILSAAILCCLLQCFPLRTSLKAAAADGRLYNQNDPYWQTVTFTRYSNTGNSMYTSGCGIFSFCNAIYALNSGQINPQELGQWGVDNTGYRPGAGGLYRDIFYQDLERDWGERYNFHIEGRYSASVEDSRLINHLANGGVAVIHVNNHFMALSGYNPTNGLYRVIESACYTGRGLAADSWVTAQKLSSGLTNVNWFALISNTKDPGFSRISTERTLYAVKEPFNFTLDTDTRSTYGVGINDANGRRVQTLYNTQIWAGCTRTVQASIDEVGQYSCYVTAHNGIKGLDSSPIPITIYCGKPSQAILEATPTPAAVNNPLTFRVSGGTAISYQIRANASNGASWDSGIIPCDINGNTVTCQWRPAATGTYSCTVELYNAYGSLKSEPISIIVGGPVDVYLNPNGGMVSEKMKVGVLGCAYGTLPVPVRDGYLFDGWFQESDGSAVNADTIITIDQKHTLMAHWTQIPPQTTPAPAAATTLPESLSPAPVIGDLNADGVCDTADAVLLHRMIAEDGSYAPTEEEMRLADINGDGILSMQDLQMLLGE